MSLSQGSVILASDCFHQTSVERHADHVFAYDSYNSYATTQYYAYNSQVEKLAAVQTFPTDDSYPFYFTCDAAFFFACYSKSYIPDMLMWTEQKSGFPTTFYGRLSSSSSIKEKKQIIPINTQNKLLQLKPISFKMNNKQSYGLLYEDVVKIYPHLCTKETQHRYINYIELLPYLLKLYQNLYQEIQELI